MLRYKADIRTGDYHVEYAPKTLPFGDVYNFGRN